MDKKKKLVIAGAALVAIILIVVALLIGNKKPMTYNVFFETDGGSSVESQIVEEGKQVKKPDDPTKTGYMFIEWTYEGKTYDFSLGVTSDLTLKGSWAKIEEDVETFIVKFETDEGTTIPNQIIKKGEKVIKPDDPVKQGYTFEGWTLNDVAYNFETVVEKNIVLKAKWKKNETPNNTTTTPANNNNNNSSNNGNNNNNNNSTNPPTPAAKKYTVTFNSNGGTAVSSQTVKEGGKATKPANPTRNGYTFAGWTLNGNAYDFNSKVNSNITLVAKWNENVKAKYTVTFNSNNGTAVSSQTVTEGSKVNKPANPTRNGYTFAGWTLNGNTYDFNSAVTGNITLVANWVQKTYTVKVSIVDDYSPARVLTVYENGVQITVSEIKYSDGAHLCSGANPNVNKNAIAGETSFIVVLTDGTQVKASVA